MSQRITEKSRCDLGRQPALDGRERALILFFVAATAAVVVTMMPVSAPLWKLVPIAALIQFPWRLLALTSVTLSILSALALNRQQAASRPQTGSRSNESTNLPGPILILALVAMLASLGYTRPQYTPTPASAGTPLLSIEFELKYEDMRGMVAWTEEMPATSPLVEQYLSGQPLVTAEVLAPGASVEMVRAAGASDELWVRSAEGTSLRFYTYYFPGWRVYLDGERLPDSALRPEGEHGLLTVDVPPGEHHVLLRWGDTAVRAIGKGMTLVSLALALGLVSWGCLRRHS